MFQLTNIITTLIQQSFLGQRLCHTLLKNKNF